MIQNNSVQGGGTTELNTFKSLKKITEFTCNPYTIKGYILYRFRISGSELGLSF